MWPTRPQPVSEELQQRRARALAMRRQGVIYRDIAKAIGVSIERARQVVLQGLRDEGLSLDEAWGERSRLGARGPDD
jgi:transposase